MIGSAQYLFSVVFPELKCPAPKRKKRAVTITDVTNDLSKNHSTKQCVSFFVCHLLQRDIDPPFLSLTRFNSLGVFCCYFSQPTFFPVSQYKDQQQRDCCRDGMMSIPVSYDCERRSEYIEIGPACVEAFLHCCKTLENERSEWRRDTPLLARSKQRGGGNKLYSQGGQFCPDACSIASLLPMICAKMLGKHTVSRL